MKLLVLLLLLFSIFSQEIPNRWDELTASDWPKALEKSNKTIILPVGILEKHGPHAPMGSDLIRVRQLARMVAEQEYAVIFPDYFYGQVNEARHIQGTFSLPTSLTLELLQATCDEIARNGFEKIFIINGHGGNPELLKYFVQTQMDKKRDYAVFFHTSSHDTAVWEQIGKMRKSDPAFDQHGGETETSVLLYMRPDLVQLDRATTESGENLNRLAKMPNVYTGIWWYGSYPLHYAGEAEVATKELGKLITEDNVRSIVEALRAVKQDTTTLQLQKEYFDEVERMSPGDRK
ncbi:creatininase family protein [Salinimicrobium xinjiangense]|uniref:creatininase family protein n=1 Tax=Salinimicrobium xinjiangense TaxID=438596 RepID=UPI00040FE643|nr:creatininase family protein [Salinimicrobium xinjiangense]